jgi:hypothetical protein
MLKYFIIFCNIFLGVTAVYASSTNSIPESHEDIFKWIIGGLCTVFFAVCSFILVKVDKNQTLLFERQKETNDKGLLMGALLETIDRNQSLLFESQKNTNDTVISLETQIRFCPTCNHTHERIDDDHRSTHIRKSDL